MATNQWNLKNPQYIGKLIFRYIRNELTPAQEKILSEWRNLSTENEKFFQEETDPEHIRQRLKAHTEAKIRILKKLQQQFSELPESSGWH